MVNLAQVAAGTLPADLVIHNANVANVFSGTYELCDVAVYGDVIAGLSSHYDGRVNFDAQGKVLVPSFIDGHIHIEDTFLTPDNFALEAAKHGTGTVLADPHEIANALGMSGLKFMFKSSQNLPVDIFYGAPSCVPASEYETCFQELGINETAEMFRGRLTTHLGEMMNFPAVISGDSEAWAKILLAGDKPLTGHAPGVTGKALNAYTASGINSDHECTTLDEAREKLSRGMWLMMREGASFHDLRTLLQLIRDNPLNAARCMAVSDDITARYHVDTGHMDAKLRIMLNEGINPLLALRMITLTPADYFRLNDRGAVSPGRKADFSLLSTDELTQNFTVTHVWKSGRLVSFGSDSINMDENSFHAPRIGVRVTHIPGVSELAVKAEGSLMRVIGITEGTIITRTLGLSPTVIDGRLVSDPERDIAKLVVLERHHDTGRYAVGFAQGLRLKKGALASSVAHDGHNYICAGMDDESIHTALTALAEMGGGLVCTLGQDVIARLALPIGGLMCWHDANTVCADLEALEDAALSLGSEIHAPFMTLSFLSLSVIPELRITDKGYCDINNGRLSLFVR